MSAATILTLANGRGIDLLDPKAADIDFEAYAEQLAKEKRYNGATPNEEYSVAEHLVRGADAIVIETEDETLAAYFSLHDAPEAVLKDDTTPKKRAIAEMCQQQFGILAQHVLDSILMLEKRHEIAVHEAAGLAWPPSMEIVADVKRYDLIMFVTEWRDLMRNAPHPNWAPYSGIRPLRTFIAPWNWRVAKAELLDRWQKLLPALNPRLALVKHLRLAHESPREQGGSSA